MINAQIIKDILSLYQKHGWNLRRVLLCTETAEKIKNKGAELFGDAEVFESKLDAVWFSRISPHGEAWELRRLDTQPFALVEVFDETFSQDEREAVLSQTETRMLDKLTPASANF